MQPEIEHFLRARTELCDRIVASRIARFGRRIEGAEFQDDTSMIEGVTEGIEAPPIIFHLIYQDAKGAYTGRGFKMNRLAPVGNDINVAGICFLRSQPRTFKASRIVEVTDLGTGEVSEDGISFFRDHPLMGPTARYKTEEEKAIAEVRDELVVLSFVSASDGHIHENEMDEILKFVGFNWDEPLDETRLATRIAAFVPDSNAFGYAMARLVKAPEKHRPLLRTMRKVIEADGKIHAAEESFYRYVAEQFS